MAPVYDCHRMTKRLLDLLEAANQDRDSQIEQAEKLLDERGEILPRIQPPFTEEEQQLGREINLMNQEIETRLQKLSQSVKEDLREINVKKQSMDKYSNPYESLQTDGVFYDKRN
ncbi:flagellar protein FliT [Domibacillus indicus]|uniref:flagellar protein FliT n=1 Tax=Domibacillus indicus TaxID=1437523 RepID=UPI0006182865|nr:flagellar protein FliT [Domibacillus indicus]